MSFILRGQASRARVSGPPPRGEGRSKKTSPHVHQHFGGWETASGFVLLKKPQRCHGFGSGQVWKSRTCGLLSRRCKRHRLCPVEHKPVCDASATSKDFLQRNLQWVVFQFFMVLVLQLLEFAGFLMDDLPRSLQKPATRFLTALRAHPNPTPNQALELTEGICHSQALLSIPTPALGR